jgi:hypothetical protein
VKNNKQGAIMSGFTSFADTAESIKRYLQQGMDSVFTDTVSVILDSPKKIQDDNRADNRLLSVYFYKITENADLKNSNVVVKDNSLENHAIAFDLYFMATAYGPDQETILRIAGRTQQLLESMVFTGSLLVGALEGTEQNIKITQLPYTQELITQMWQAMELSLRLVFYFLATPVFIDTGSKEMDAPVVERYAGKPEDSIS